MTRDRPPYILWLHWKNFYVHDALDERPLVVVRDKKVLDPNPAAEARGIQRGMPQRQAANLIQGCVFRPWDREEFVERQTQWLDICSEFTGILEPIDQHIAALDLSGHPRRMETTEKLIRDLIARMRLPLCYGVAHTKWMAQLACMREDPGFAVRDPQGFLASLPVDDLLPVAPEHRARLEFLGYRTVGQLAQVPLETLQDQFGEEGLTIAQAAKGGISEPVQPLYPLDSIRECFLFESPIEDWETIRLTRHRLAARLAKRLHGRQSSFVTLEVEYENGFTKRTQRTFTKALYNPLTTAAALSLLLPNEPNEGAQISPSANPIVALRVTLSQLEIVRQRQHQLIETSSRPAAESAIRSVQDTFGDHAIRLGAEIVPPRRERVLKEWRHATGWH